MNRIILAIDGLKPPAGAITQAIELTKINNAHLAGIFLDDITYTSYKIYDLVNPTCQLQFYHGSMADCVCHRTAPGS